MKELTARQSLTLPFTISFSEHGDLLSQWRAYAQDATGVSIGFEPKDGLEEVPFEEAFTSMNIGEQYVPRNSSRFYVYQVHYFPQVMKMISLKNTSTMLTSTSRTNTQWQKQYQAVTTDTKSRCMRTTFGWLQLQQNTTVLKKNEKYGLVGSNQ